MSVFHYMYSMLKFILCGRINYYVFRVLLFVFSCCVCVFFLEGAIINHREGNCIVVGD